MIRTGLYASAFIIAVMAAISVYGLNAIPADAEVPRQWDFQGNVKTWPRDTVLIFGPLFALGISALFALLPFIDPRGDNIRRSAGLYLGSWIGIVALLAVIHASIIIGAARGADPSSPPDAVLFMVCLLLILLGNYLPKSRSNFFLGVRTPWTLSSEHSWNVANRVAGWLFVLTGLAAAAAEIASDSRLGYIILAAGVAGAAAISIAVSYFVWRADRGRSE